MNVIALNGSPRKKGNTAQALELMAEELGLQNIATEIIHIGQLHLYGCIACGYCWRPGKNCCIFTDDIVNDVAQKMRAADGFILASPTYYAGIAGTMKAFLDRVFFSSSSYFKYKVATSISVVRRSGGVDVVHQLNNYLNLAETVMPPSQYWTVAYGMDKGEILQDKEGVQTLRKNARAMGWLLNIINAGKSTIPFPKEEDRVMTNFVR
jgi:multimeric flavodoxin WrbA